MTEFTRRTVLTGGALTTAATAVAHSPAAAADAAKMSDFLDLSEFLTGINRSQLSPFVDVMNVKQTYFDKADAQNHAAFEELLKIFKDHKTDPDLGDRIFNKSGDDVKYLARDIIIAWYLGAWCNPADLKKYDDGNPSPTADLLSPDVLTANAYTQGYVWRVAQAHPMGYSEMRFGYWNVNPPPLSNFVKLK